MNLSSIKSLVTSKVARQVLTVQKHSPVILFGAGVVGVVGTVALACKATLKVDDVLTDHQKTMQDINTVVHEDYSEQDKIQDKTVLMTKTIMTIGRLYAPAIVVGVISIGCLTGSHIVLTKRNAGLTAAYAALEKGFREYRRRVVDDLGEDKDREFRYGFEEKTVVDETDEGPVKTVIKKANPSGHSIYAKLFDDRTKSWSPWPEYNVVFLRSQQNFLNDKLRAKGHVFLNEVYDALGLERTKEGAVVGWLWNGDGDNFIDFGIFNRQMEPQHLDFFTGREGAVWLDFNVDGVIWDKI
jgi:hypothetical protein